MDDDDLVARVAAGDDTALRELFGRHAPWLAARLRAVLPAADVEDVLQETFLAAWRGERGYRPQGACGGRPGHARPGRDRTGPGRPRGSGRDPGAGREPGTRGVAAHVRTGPASGRGGGDARRAARHGEEPRPPGP